MAEVLAHDPASGEPRDDVIGLDQYYIPTRYPNGLPAGTSSRSVYSRPEPR